MSRVAELWAALTADEQDRATAALRTTLRDRGVQLVLAIAREARPAEEAPPGCDDCHSSGDLTAFIDDDRAVLLLCGHCWTARMLARARGPMPPTGQEET